MRISVLPYDPVWPRTFERHRDALSRIAGASDLSIEHVGSTSVAGLSAKPIVDILLGVPDSEALDGIRDRIVASDRYCYMRAYERAVPDRRFFVGLVATAGNQYPSIIDDVDWANEIPLRIRECHVHVLRHSDESWSQVIAFRDLLRQNLDAREKYQRRKLELAQRSWASSKDYATSKDPVILELLAERGTAKGVASSQRLALASFGRLPYV